MRRDLKRIANVLLRSTSQQTEDNEGIERRTRQKCKSKTLQRPLVRVVVVVFSSCEGHVLFSFQFQMKIEVLRVFTAAEGKNRGSAKHVTQKIHLAVTEILKRRQRQKYSKERKEIVAQP